MAKREKEVVEIQTPEGPRGDWGGLYYCYFGGVIGDCGLGYCGAGRE